MWSEKKKHYTRAWRRYVLDEWLHNGSCDDNVISPLCYVERFSNSPFSNIPISLFHQQGTRYYNLTIEWKPQKTKLERQSEISIKLVEISTSFQWCSLLLFFIYIFFKYIFSVCSFSLRFFFILLFHIIKNITFINRFHISCLMQKDCIGLIR